MLPFRCSACLWDLSNLCHEAAHFLCGLFLHLPCDVGVGAKREARVVVAEHTADGFDIHAVLECQGRERMPLRYNNDKPEKPRNFKGLEVYQADFSSFSNPKNQAAKPLYRRGC